MKTNKYIKLIYQFAVISILCFFSYSTKAQSITTSPILVTEYCGGVDIVVNYTKTGTFGGSNVFTAQLSDLNGSFSSPINIGQLTSVTNGTILATIPISSVLGLGYRIRVVSSSPSIVGTNNGTNLKINPAPTANAGVDQSICANDLVNLAGVLGPAAPFGTWTTSGTGTFNNPNNLIGVYTPSASDITNKTVTLTLTSNDPVGSCLAVSDQMIVSISKAPTSNAGVDQNTCILTNTINVVGVIAGPVISSNWSTLGTGSFNNSTLLNAIYTPSALDKSNGFVKLILSTNGPIGPPCAAARDTMIISFNPIVLIDAGFDQTICSNSSVVLNATTNATSGTLNWTTSGTGVFTNGNTLTPIYFPSITDKISGSVKLTITNFDPINACQNNKDSMILTINQLAVANAGIDKIVCASSNNVSLIGTVSGSVSTGSWSTLGTGTFTSASSLITNYILSATDKIAGTVRLVLTSSDPVGPCNSVSDTMIITINPIAAADAGPDQVICGNSSAIVTGTVGGSATSGSWSSSTNSSFISLTALTEYFPTLTEIANGFVVLTYTTNDPIGPCPAAKDSLVVALLAPAYSNAGADQTVCASNVNVSLAGNISGTVSTGTWGTLGTGTFSNPTSLVTNYTLSAIDKAAGLVKLILTSSDPVGPCSSVSDTMIVIINPQATVNAGPDQIICSNSSVNVTGTVGGSATSGSWTSSTNSTFISFTSTTNYIPTPTEALNGSVVLTYTSNVPIGPCSAAKDSLIVTLISPPFSDAGFDQTVCSNVSFVNLAGNFGNGANFANWSTLGTGTFNNIIGNTANYIPSPLDKLIGFVEILYTTDNPAGPCNKAVDTVKITFRPIATIFAGIDQTICRNNNLVLNASTTATSGTLTWTTSGSGIFINGNSLTPTYVPSLADNISGSVTLTLTNFDPSNICQTVNDAMLLTINQLAIADAGLDQIVCSSVDTVLLVGNISGAAIKGSWRTLGTGTFTNSGALVTSYILSPNDKAVGLVKLILTTKKPIGPCNSAVDTMIITFNPNATIFAGIDQTICRNNNLVLNASTNATSGVITWSTNGTGVFLNVNTLNPTYIPSLADNILGNVKLTVTNYDPISICQNVNDSMNLTINPAANVNAGLDQIICGSKDTISLVGTISGSPTNVSWNTLGTGTFTSDTALITNYILSATDKLAGVVSIIFKDGQCFAVRDTVVITINQIPTINAGLDQVICGNNAVNLVGLIGGSATIGTWSSSTNSLFSSTNSVVNYFPTDSQIANGSFFITYTSNDPSGLCGIASDSMEVTVNVPPTVNAGKDIYTCSYATSVDIIGTKAGFPTNSLWVTLNGSGSFIDSSSLSTKYIPSAADLAAKSIIISLTTNDPIGPCYAAYDDVNVYFKDSNVTFTSVVKNIYCDSMEIEFVNDSNNVGYTFAWDFGDGFFSNIANPIHTYNYTGSINVNLIASGPGSCIESVNNSFNINSVKPKADFVVNNLNQCLNDNSFELNNASKDASTGFINNVKWDFGDNTNSTATIPNNKTYNKSGNYNIKLVVSTTNGCQDSIVKGVNVLQSPEKPIVTLFDGKVLISSSLVANHWYYSSIEIPGANNKYYATSKFGVYKLRVDSTNGCSNFSDDLDLKYTSKTENVTNNKFKIYPNPTKGLFNIESQLELNYSIYDYSGKEIITGKKDGNIQLLDLSNFKSGIYLIKLYNDQEQFISKIIKD